jgi:enoyl-CoA hydratase/carnithine racemase
MEYETLLVAREDAVMTVRLNRPDKRNAMSTQLHRDLQDLCHRLGDDFETRVVILAGEGSGFSAGADTSEWGKPGPDNELALRHQSGIGSRTCNAIEALDQITIAAVHGFAVGGGAVLAVSCDLRVASEPAWFSIPEVELGIPLSWHALPRLAREVGHAKALELTILCERFNAQEAHQWGLVTHLAPDGEHLSVARALAEKIVAKPRLPVALTKASMKAIRRASEQGEIAYADPDLLLYTRMLQQRARRRERQSGEGESS